MKTFSAAFAACVLAPAASAQASVITVERVKETVSWLAADERAGRDTGSPQLVEAGEWIAAHFAKAGLTQVREGSWLHEFPLTGWTLDSTAVALELSCKPNGDSDKGKPLTFVLAPDADVRQATVSEALASSGEGEACTVALFDDPVVGQMLLANNSRRLVVCEVADDHPAWQRAKGAHMVMGQRRQASRPVLLVRKGVLHDLPADLKDATWTAKWQVGAPEKAEVPQFNVMAVRRGASKPDEYVLVSAHYDHIGIGLAVDGDAINNGADDDASGTTAVILLAESLAKEPNLARSVLFVCFTGEEKGLLGSKAFAAKPPVPLEKVVANVNIEMIGRPEEGKRKKAWITGVEYSDFAAIAATALQRSGIELVDFGMAKQLFAQSDNWSLAQKGVVAHSLSAGSLHADYHRPSDEVKKLDLEHMTEIVPGLREVVIEFANRADAPKWSDAWKNRPQRGR